MDDGMDGAESILVLIWDHTFVVWVGTLMYYTEATIFVSSSLAITTNGHGVVAVLTNCNLDADARPIPCCY